MLRCVAYSQTTMPTQEDWEREATRIIKAAMKRRGMTHKMLVRDLRRHGIELEEQSLINKLNRGKFPFAFALLVLRVLHIDEIDVPRL